MNHATASAAQFFLQLSVILIACRLCRILMRCVGQPAVIGEMVAGVLLGPSLLGAIFPNVAHALFSQESRPVLFAVAQLGLTFYMFVVGLEFRSDLFRQHLRTAAAVSGAGILGPFVLGGGIALWLCHQGGFFAPTVTVPMGILFIGAAMSITAFPMLARIILEQGLTGTPMGAIALAAGSIDDAAAWILLAVVLGCIAGSPLLAVAALMGGILYVLLCLNVVHPFLKWLGKQPNAERELMGALILLLSLGAWFTDMIGLYSVFGAFIFGLAVPRGGIAEKTAERIGPLTTSLLLPFFFTYSGLNTRIGLLNSTTLWVICGLITLSAIAGKLFFCYGAARLSGSPPAESFTIASLMNARGLMELILLNIGLQAGLISQTLFTMLVLMAIITTLMAAPGFHAAKKFSASSC